MRPLRTNERERYGHVQKAPCPFTTTRHARNNPDGRNSFFSPSFDIVKWIYSRTTTPTRIPHRYMSSMPPHRSSPNPNQRTADPRSTSPDASPSDATSPFYSWPRSSAPTPTSTTPTRTSPATVAQTHVQSRVEHQRRKGGLSHPRHPLATDDTDTTQPREQRLTKLQLGRNDDPPSNRHPDRFVSNSNAPLVLSRPPKAFKPPGSRSPHPPPADHIPFATLASRSPVSLDQDRLGTPALTDFPRTRPKVDHRQFTSWTMRESSTAPERHGNNPSLSNPPSPGQSAVSNSTSKGEDSDIDHRHSESSSSQERTPKTPARVAPVPRAEPPVEFVDPGMHDHSRRDDAEAARETVSSRRDNDGNLSDPVDPGWTVHSGSFKVDDELSPFRVTRSEHLSTTPRPPPGITGSSLGDVHFHVFMGGISYWVYEKRGWVRAEEGHHHPVFGAKRVLCHRVKDKTRMPNWVLSSTMVTYHYRARKLVSRF